MKEKFTPVAIELRKKLLDGSLDVNELSKYKDQIQKNVTTQINCGSQLLFTEEVKNLLYVCLDYYTYSKDGDVLITDHDYDMLMREYVMAGYPVISRADNLTNQTQWEFVRHESPGMVGTVKKIYSYEELEEYLYKHRSPKNYREFRIAPKFDGISSAIKIDWKGRILLGVTRNNGMEGQNITKVIQNARNSKQVSQYYASKLKEGQVIWVKTELCVGKTEFDDLILIKKYRNRRSATSGIVNSPKNLDLARFITIIPLASHNPQTDEVEYVPLDSKIVRISKASTLMDEIYEVIDRNHNVNYEFRTDGVVLYPLGDDELPNYDDIMDNAIAYKINTSEGLTDILFGYVSVGRLGYAVPMLRVKPVEVNETIVEDVTLSSFDKFVNMDLHEGETVVIYSAGDVIPQVRIPEKRHYQVGAPLLEIKKRCPYCNKKLVRYKNTYKCENPECIRVAAGKISNFVIKLKAENVSDKTIEDLVTNHLIETIPDLFELSEKQISVLSGYGEDSARLIIGEINKIRTKEIPISTLMGALGIQGISEKKCKNIFKVMTLDKMLKMKKGDLKYELVGADNTGLKTAEIFTDFLKENKELIQQLLGIMNIVNDVDWKGNVVFTGSRYPDLEEKFKEFGYETSNNVNGKTIVVIDSSYDHSSTKCKSAKQKGIDIIHVSEVDDVFKELKKQL